MPPPPQMLTWQITQRDRTSGEPTHLECYVGRLRVQLYRHRARPTQWTAHVNHLVVDELLTSLDIEGAQDEVLTRLHRGLVEHAGIIAANLGLPAPPAQSVAVGG